MSSSLQPLFKPQSVAVVGASRRPRSIGYELVANLLRAGFEGPVYPVNPSARSVHSIPAFPTLDAIPGEVDLAVITVPRDHVMGVVDDAIAKGVKALVTITAGFKEVDAEGAALEAEIRRKLRKAGVRMVGPNCMGVIDTDPSVRLNATFATTNPPAGNVAFASQSGALGEAILETASHMGLGLSSFVSLGNKADISSNDLLAWWAEDPRTSVVMLYLESFGNPHHFARLARSLTRGAGKPILAVKSGRTRRGAEAASSHTGSLAGSDAATSSLLRQCGVIRANTVSALFTLAQGFANQPLPAGRRVAILTNAGGPGIMTTDAAVHFGLELAEVSEKTRQTLKAALPVEASVRNPVDMIATAGPKAYATCAEALLNDPNVDGLIVIFVSPITLDAREVAVGIVEGVRAAGADHKPVLSCFMGKHHGNEGMAVLRDARIPAFAFPEAAAETLAAMAKFAEYRRSPIGSNPTLNPPVQRDRAASVLDIARRRMGPEGGWVRFAESMHVLEAYGLPVAPWAVIEDAKQAVAFAEEHGYPVVLKVDSEAVLHKTEVGGVRVDLRRAQDVRGAFAEIRHNVADIPGDHRFVIQAMLQGGRETLLGVTADPSFGHVLAFGLGGVFVEITRDVTFRVHPVTDVDAREMIEGIRAFPILAGARGSRPVDLAALEEAILRISQLVADFPEVAELDLNPFFAHHSRKGQGAADARLRLAERE
ncbi:MAG: acetate--CoA ligase family protein [Proteobacteria bacterium]|nr:acetate--CoA ligase family protein [Pseudomonadota bacterium]